MVLMFLSMALLTLVVNASLNLQTAAFPACPSYHNCVFHSNRLQYGSEGQSQANLPNSSGLEKGLLEVLSEWCLRIPERSLGTTGCMYHRCCQFPSIFHHFVAVLEDNQNCPAIKIELYDWVLLWTS